MRPRNPDRPSIDPRQVLRAGGKQSLDRLLRRVGYVPQERALNDLALALRRSKPLLLGGPRGAGKTAIAEDLAEACNLPLYYIPGHEGIDAADVMGSWDRAEQEVTVRQAVAAGMSLAEARRAKWDWDYYEAGEFLEAYREAQRAAAAGEPPPVLLIDEMEKLPVELQHVLLQPLARGFADVPKLEGIVGVKCPAHRPIVVLTSNDLDKLSEPLTSRCFVTWVCPPTPQEEIGILRARVPAASPQLLAAVAGMINFIRDEMPEIRNKPGIRESRDLLEALVDDGVTRITTETVREYLACLGKGKRELEVLMQNDDGLARAATHPDDKILAWTFESFVSAPAGASLTVLGEAA